jgi:fibro-slime domain-containing protein
MRKGGIAACLMLLASGLRPSAAEEYLTLKAALYDHDYGDFGGEFSATGVTGCPRDNNKWAPGMVRDTLVFDSASGKKIPRRGALDMCSGNLEKWFDPAQSRSASCGNLFLKNVGDSAKPIWRLDDPQFFPMDAMSRQPAWPVGVVGPLSNDYAYCMEVNAALTYKGGETMKFRADDDLWVFLDNRLAVDQGGIHFAIQGETKLDSLPFLKGKLGKTMDLDIYYCSRQPGTAVLGMETTAELKPLAVKNIKIVDTAGEDVSARQILTGKMRLCARPFYQDPGEEMCGNYKPPPDLGFLSADWDLNGKPISFDGGQACLDLDPALFPNETRIHLTAKAEDHSSRISLTLYRLARPLSGRLSGDGRAEAVTVSLDTAAGPAPEGLEMQFDFAGSQRYAWVKPDSSNPWILSGALGDAYVGPPGNTGFTPVPATARQTLFTSVSQRNVDLGDGVSPILTGAWFHWGRMGGRPAYLDLQSSETLAGAGDSLPSGLLLKRKDGAPEPAPNGSLGIQVRQERYFLALPEAAAGSLHPGDSVSLSPAAADREGNAARAHFIPLLFPGNLEETVGPVRVRGNPVRGAVFEPEAGVRALFPVSADGQPLAGGEAERRWAAARGPVLEFSTRVPIERVQFAFFDHLGAFVNSVDRTFSEKDWDAMRAAGPGDTTWVRLMWYPVSRDGGRLGTGAYVVKGRLWTRGGALVNGPDGELAQSRAASVQVQPRLFGYLRD